MKTSFNYTFFLVTLLMSMTIESSQADLKAPFDLSSAKVLPQGVRNVRYKGMFVNGTERFDNYATSTILADPLFKNVSIRDILDPITEPDKKGLLRGYLEANNWNLDEILGETTGAVNVEAIAHVPVIAFGLSKKLTLAVAIPVVQYDFNVETSFIASENFEKLANKIKDDGKTEVLTELKDKMKDPVRTKLNDFRYNNLEGERNSALGDIKLVSKYQLSNQPEYAFSIQNELTLPTGKEADLNKLVDVGTGHKQTDIGFSLLADWYINERLTVNNIIGYTWQLPDHTRKRIPYTSDSPLSPYIDENVSRDLGDMIIGQIGAKYDLFKGIFINSGYTFQMKDKDRYAGYAFDHAQYQWMEAKTRQRMQTIQAGLGYSTVKMFQENRFPVPFEASLTYTTLLEGKNVTKDPLLAFELSMFF